MGIIGVLLYLAIIVISIAGLWKMFEKAGHPGWAAIIPIYNIIILCKIAEKPEWWVLLLIIPIVNLVVAIWLWNRVVKRFGKDEAFTVGVILLGFVFIPILGFGDAQYKGMGPGGASDELLDSEMA